MDGQIKSAKIRCVPVAILCSGRMELMMRKRLACILTTYSWAGSLPKPQDLGSNQATTRGWACMID